MVRQLLEWYGKEGRRLSFRASSDPFHILVAEIMLRKTTARQVDRVFREFIRRFPTPSSLASAPEGEVEAVLRPLGIRSRARALIEIARAIQEHHGGVVPSRRDELVRLPSVGDYVSGCVLSFCFGERVPLVDTNVMRVFTRLFGLWDASRAEREKEVRMRYLRILPDSRHREFHYAILDVSAAYCRPKDPRCDGCPLQRWCSYAAMLREAQPQHTS